MGKNALLKKQAELRDQAALLSTEPTPDRMLDMANLIGEIVDLMGEVIADLGIDLKPDARTAIPEEVDPEPAPEEGFRPLVDGEPINPSTDEVLIGCCLPWRPCTSSYGTKYIKGDHWPMRRPVAADTGAI